MLELFDIASKLGIGTGVAGSVYSIVVGASLWITVGAGLVGLIGGGVDSILEMGWLTFRKTVISIAEKKSKKRAIAW